jgi:hypothetical protein
MLKTLVYPFFAAQVAVEMIVTELTVGTKRRVRAAVRDLVADTISDAKEINELKAEVAMLRAEINDIKYSGTRIGAISVL